MIQPSELAPLLPARRPPLAYDSEVEFALLDTQGVIVAVNNAWLAFCAGNGGAFARTVVGSSYLDICDRACDAGTCDAGSSVRAAIAGELPAPVVVTFPCDAPGVPRSFDVLVSSRLDDHANCLGATVTISQVGLHSHQAAPAGGGSVSSAGGAAGTGADSLDLLARIDERERIAAHLNTVVMSGLFSIGIGLQGMLDLFVRREDKARLTRYVDALDGIVHEIRTAVFELVPAPPDRIGLKRRLLEVVDESGLQSLGTDVEFSGPLDSEVGGDAGDIIVEVVREALSNVVLLSAARTVNVSVALSGSLIEVQISDDGARHGRAGSGSDLRRLGRYAEESGGDLQITTRADGGTLLRWTALLERNRNLATTFARPRERPSA
jgi:hypothetical protein